MNQVRVWSELGWALVWSCVLFTSCGKKDSDPIISGNTEQITLLKSDLELLKTREHTGLDSYDQTTRGRVTQIFGGTSAASLNNYLYQRLHVFIDPSDKTAGFTPLTLFNQSWLKGDSSSNAAKAKSSKAGAANIGAELWLAGITANAEVKFYAKGAVIPVRSTRTGIMVVGEAYQRTLSMSDGRELQLIPEVRHGFLLHEARHSDCTGGITSHDIQNLRNSSSSQDAHQYLDKMHCGHLHTLCPAGHHLAGIAACDAEPWGAYAITEIFYRAVREDENLSVHDRAIMDGVIADMASRTLVPMSGSPDMSSEGIKD